ncbi:MAG: YbaB/EbfC family nucleoid-associated protein [Kiritimatiellae bacterium]|nr:YbaB/EbfC family nucleoid-associated protein [Kiritimatiellia bacterium]
MKQALQMRNEAKRMEAEVKKITAEYSNGGITIIAKGDMSIESIKVEPEAYAEVIAGKSARFETMLLNVMNGALKRTKEETQKRMLDMMRAGGGAGLFGK